MLPASTTATSGSATADPALYAATTALRAEPTSASSSDWRKCQPSVVVLRSAPTESNGAGHGVDEYAFLHDGNASRGGQLQRGASPCRVQPGGTARHKGCDVRETKASPVAAGVNALDGVEHSRAQHVVPVCPHQCRFEPDAAHRLLRRPEPGSKDHSVAAEREHRSKPLPVGDPARRTNHRPRLPAPPDLAENRRRKRKRASP